MTSPKGSQATRSAPPRGGFTLTELLLAIMITGIILSAVASLVFAVGRLWAHNGAADTISSYQHSVSQQMADLLRHSRLVLDVSNHRIGLWGCDLDHDGEIDVRELVEIRYDAQADRVERIQYDAPAGVHVLDASVFAASDGFSSVTQPYGSYKHVATLARSVTRWEVSYNQPAPSTGTITVDFRIEEEAVERNSTFSATLRSRDADLAAEILSAVAGQGGEPEGDGDNDGG